MKGKIIYMDTEKGDDKKDGSNWENAVKSWEAVSKLIDAPSRTIIIEDEEEQCVM